MLAIVFGILASLCFAVASLLAQRGLYVMYTPWGAWITLVANTVFLLAFHFALYRDASIFVLDNLTFVADWAFLFCQEHLLFFRRHVIGGEGGNVLLLTQEAMLFVRPPEVSVDDAHRR